MTGHPDSAFDLLDRIKSNHNPHADPVTDVSPRIRRRTLRRHIRLSHRYDDHPNVNPNVAFVSVEYDGVIP